MGSPILLMVSTSDAQVLVRRLAHRHICGLAIRSSLQTRVICSSPSAGAVEPSGQKAQWKAESSFLSRGTAYFRSLHTPFACNPFCFFLTVPDCGVGLSAAVARQ